jgi:hypothetical protein
MKLTGRQRWRQAHLKQQLVFRKQMREFNAGERWDISCPVDKFIIAELERAYEAGLADARAALTRSQP